MIKKTLVVGASLNEARYSNMAVRRLREKNIPVVALGLKEGVIVDVKVKTRRELFKDIDTVTLYINPKRQIEYYNYILKIKPRRVIFNPGTENTEFIFLLKENNILPEIACTLVLLSINQY